MASASELWDASAELWDILESSKGAEFRVPKQRTNEGLFFFRGGQGHAHRALLIGHCCPIEIQMDSACARYPLFRSTNHTTDVFMIKKYEKIFFAAFLVYIF